MSRMFLSASAVRGYLVAWWCLCLWVAITLLGAMKDALYLGPFKDMWWMMPVVQHCFSGDCSLQELVSAHGGAHRLLIPRLLFLLEYGVFNGTNGFLVSVSIFTQLVLVGVWCWQVRAMPWSRPYKVFGWGIVLLLSFSGMQFENFLYTFDCQWFLANTLSVLALLVLVFFIQSGSVRALVGVGLFGVAASFCSFLGLCALLLAAVLVLLTGKCRSASILFSLFVVLYAGWYVAGFESGSYAVFDSVGGTPSVQGAVVLLSRLLQWTLIYLGSPLSRDAYLAGALQAMLGLALLAVEVIVLVRQWRGGIQEGPRLFCVVVAVYAVAVAVATGLGRLYFINTANEDRYQTINLTFWLSVCLLALMRMMSASETKKALCTCLIALWSVYIGVFWHVRDLRERVAEFELVKASAFAQQFGILDFHAIRDTLILGDKAKHINRAAMYADFLQERQWGAFVPSKRVSLPVDAMADYPACPLAHYDSKPLSDESWLVTMVLDEAYSGDIVLHDHAGVVRGVLVGQRWYNASWQSVAILAHRASQWLGYARVQDSPNLLLRGLLVADNQVVCEVGFPWLGNAGHEQ